MDAAPLPGILKAKKTNIEGTRPLNNDDKTNVFTGFNTVNVKLDVASGTPQAYQEMAKVQKGIEDILHGDHTKRVATIDLGGSLPTDRANTAALSQARNIRADSTVEELRNYIVLMDKYSLHNFLIYEGHALKDTPEFQSFQRSYQYQWGSIASIIQQLEDFLGKHDVKLAIVNGPRIVQLAKLNLPTLKRAEVLSCLANSAQIEANIESGAEFSRKQVLRYVVRIQALIRTFLCVRRFRDKLKAVRAAIVIQAFARRMIEKRMHKHRLKRNATFLDEQWGRHRRELETWWRSQTEGSAPGFPMGQPRPLQQQYEQQAVSIPPSPSPSSSSKFSKSRLIIFLPSISVSEKIRFEFDNYSAVQNTCVSQFYQLADPNVTMIYISPTQMTSRCSLRKSITSCNFSTSTNAVPS